MRIIVQTLIMLSYFKLLLAGLPVFSLANPLSLSDTAIFALGDLSTSLNAWLGENYFVLPYKNICEIASMAEQNCVKSPLTQYVTGVFRKNRKILQASLHGLSYNRMGIE